MEINGPDVPRGDEVLTDEALELLAALHREINGRRKELLAKRLEVQADLDAGGTLDFLEETKEIREGDWQVSPAPPALRKRWVEITGPTSAKMVINALNSGSTGFMADFEDANSPSWSNMVGGQVNLADAVRGTAGVRRRGQGQAVPPERRDRHAAGAPARLAPGGAPPDRGRRAGGGRAHGLRPVHPEQRARPDQAGQRAYFYLPKMESHLEARMWNDAMTLAEEQMGLDHGTARGTVLIETLPAAFQMDEILYELRDHSAGLNAGRWDYIFSAIKRFKERPEFVTPDRVDVTMTVPFMHAYSELLVKTCHRRGAHAMGGMSAVIPSRTDEEAAQKALDAVASDKRREAGAGFDGSWVAHPDSVEPAMGEFEKVLGDSDNQVDKQRDDVDVAAADILAIDKTEGRITEKGLRLNVNVGIQYISSWLRGQRRRRHLRADGGRGDRRDLPRADLAVDPARGHPGRRPHRHAGAGARAGRRGAGDHPQGDRRRRVVRARRAAGGVARPVRGGRAER